MKIKFALFVIAFFLLNPSPLLAQTKSGNEYYQDLLNDYRAYQSLTEPFGVARSRNLTYKSVEAQVEFLEISRRLILAEVKSIKDYVSFIRTVLSDATRILNYQENYLYIKLDDELAFLDQTESKVQTLSTLADTDTLMTDLGKHYAQISQMGYEIKSIIAIGSIKKIQGNLQIEREKLRTILSEASGSARLSVSQEKFDGLGKDQQQIDLLVKSMERFQNNIDQREAEEIQNLSSQAISRISLMLSGYDNIIANLK